MALHHEGITLEAQYTAGQNQGSLLAAAPNTAAASGSQPISIGDQLSGIKDEAASLMEALKTTISGGFTTEILPALTGGIEQIRAALSTQGVEGAVQVAQTVLTQFLNSLVAQLPTLISTAGSMLQALATGITEALPELALIVSEVINTLSASATEALPTLITAAGDLLMAVVDAVCTNIGPILDAAIQILTALVQGLTDNIQLIIDAALQLIDTLCTWITENLPMLIETGVELLIALINGLVSALPSITDKIVEVVSTVAQLLIDNLPLLIQAGVELLIAVVSGIIQAREQIREAIWEILDSICTLIMETDWIQLGIDIIGGIIQGLINQADAIWEALKSICKEALDNMMRFFGIHSPSTLMRDAIGKMLPLGMAVGVEATAPKAVSAVENVADDMISTAQSAVQNQQYAAGYMPQSVEVGSAGSAGASDAVVISVPLNIDGREFARATARYQGARLAWEG